MKALEHEIVHALQDKRYPEMPIELKEYEAYMVNASIDYLRDHKDDVKWILQLFLLSSVETDYRFRIAEGKDIPDYPWTRGLTM